MNINNDRIKFSHANKAWVFFITFQEYLIK